VELFVIRDIGGVGLSVAPSDAGYSCTAEEAEDRGWLHIARQLKRNAKAHLKAMDGGNMGS
jgi:hypothetical protein